MSTPVEPDHNAETMNYQEPAKKSSRGAWGMLAGGLGLLAITVIALVAVDTLYIWPAVAGAVFTVWGIVQLVMKK